MTVADVIARRRAAQAGLVAGVGAWAECVGPAIGARAVVVVGSVARGDFNVWSDVDVLVIAPDLPPSLGERLALVRVPPPPPGVEVIAWTTDELLRRRQGGTDPLACDAYGAGVVVFGTLPSPVGGVAGRRFSRKSVTT